MQEVAKTGVDSFDEISNSIVSISQSMKSLSDTELARVTEEAMQLVNVMGTDVSEVAKVSGQLMKQFGTTGLESLDLIAKGLQNGMDYAGDYTDTLNEYSVYFSSLGFSAEDMFNVLAEGAEAGAFNLDKGGDAVKEFGIRSKDGSGASEDAFEALGFNADKLSSTFAKGGDGDKTAYAEFVNSLAGVDDQVKRNEIGVAFVGTQYEDMEKDVTASTGSIVDHMKNVEGASMEVSQNKKTFSQEMQGAWNKIQLAIEPVGKILQDFVLQVMPHLIQGVRDISKAFTELSPTIQKVGIGFGAFIAILPALLIGIGGAVSLFGSFINGMVAVGKVIGIIGKSPRGLKTAFNAIKTVFTVLGTCF